MAQQILLVGAGGIGSEVSNNIAISKLPCTLSIMDYDTISLSNLNRQFLFTIQDIGKPKALILSNKLFNIYGVKCAPIIDDITVN